MQNLYNLVHRRDDALIDALAGEGIAYVPFFPLGGFTPLQSAALRVVAERLGDDAERWRWPGCCSAPRTSCSSRARRRVAHLRENVAAASLTLSDGHLRRLDAIAALR